MSQVISIMILYVFTFNGGFKFIFQIFPTILFIFNFEIIKLYIKNVTLHVTAGAVQM